MDRQGLVALFVRHKVPPHHYGVGEAKTIGHLLNEINNNECVLVETPTGLLRTTSAAALIVQTTRPGGEVLTLKEQKQVFTDGRERERKFEFQRSIGEKMRLGEKPDVVARRALAEELGITADVELEYLGTEQRGPTTSPSYPGISNIYDIYRFKVMLPAHLFKPEGYTEVQPDKTTYFVWTNS